LQLSNHCFTFKPGVFPAFTHIRHRKEKTFINIPSLRRLKYIDIIFQHVGWKLTRYNLGQNKTLGVMLLKVLKENLH